MGVDSLPMPTTVNGMKIVPLRSLRTLRLIFFIAKYAKGRKGEKTNFYP